MPLKHTVTEIALKNGAKGLIIDVPGTTVVSYEFGFHAGRNFVRSDDITQTAHIMEHLAFGANKKFASPEAFSEEFSKNGAYSNAYTGNVDMVYVADAPLMEWDRILELQQVAIATPRYNQKALDAEKSNVNEELTGYANNNIRLLWQATMHEAGLFNNVDAEAVKTLPNIDLKDIKEHFDRTHTTRNMRFILAGDLEKHHDVIIRSLEKMELKFGERLTLPKTIAKRAALTHIYRKDVPNLYFDLHFFVNRTLSWPEQIAMGTLNHILNGTFHSRVWGAARKKGIAYYNIRSGVDTDVDGITDWNFRSQVGLENARELFTLFTEQLEMIAKNGPTEKEVAMAKEYRLGSLQMSAQTVGGLAGWYDEWYFERDQITNIDDIPRHTHAVSVDGIKRLAQEFISSGMWAFGGLGNIKLTELQKHEMLFADMIDRAVK